MTSIRYQDGYWDAVGAALTEAPESLFTDKNLRAQIIQSLTGHADDYDVTELVDAYQAKYGTIPVDQVPADAYWALVSQFDIS